MSNLYQDKLLQPFYYPPFNGYSQNGPLYYSQHPPPYSQRFIPRPFLLKHPLSPQIPNQHIYPTLPSSLRRHLSRRGPPQVQRHTPNLHSRRTTLKRQRPSTTQPPDFPKSEALSPIKLARGRPHDWRSGYMPPFKSYFWPHFESFIIPYTTPCCMSTPLRLNPLLVVTRADNPNIFYDLRRPQSEDAIFLPSLNRPANKIDFYQLITSPPIHHMTIWHRKLPWEINIEASQPNGIIIYDLFQQIYQQLHQSISRKEYYTDELAPGDREVLTMAFQVRRSTFQDQLSAGVRRIDFLGQETYFVGLKRSRGGRWEFKTQLPPPKQRMIID